MKPGFLARQQTGFMIMVSAGSSRRHDDCHGAALAAGDSQNALDELSD